MKKLIKLLGIILIIYFLVLYFGSYSSDYYSNKNILTEEAIERFESDLKSGKTIKMSNYIEEEKDYNNKVSSTFLKISNYIDKLIRKSLKYIVKYLESE